MVSLLKLKAWQAFLFAGAATYLSVLLRILMILHATVPYGEYVDMGITVWDGVGGLVTLLWLYTLGIQLDLRVPGDTEDSMTFFKVCFIGLILVMIAMVWMELEETSDRRIQMGLLLLALIFHVYTYYVAAKLLIQVEKSNHNLGSTLVALIILPIGIWFIQPRINKVFQDNFEAFDSDTPLDHQLDHQPQN